MIGGNEFIGMYLESRLQNMDIYLNNPSMAAIAVCPPLAVLSLDYVMGPKGLAATTYINELLAEFRKKEEMMHHMMAATKLIGVQVIKKSGKPFKGTNRVNTVMGIILHPYKTGWHLAYTFDEDDSCISVEQVKEYRGH